MHTRAQLFQVAPGVQLEARCPRRCHSPHPRSAAAAAAASSYPLPSAGCWLLAAPPLLAAGCCWLVAAPTNRLQQFIVVSCWRLIVVFLPYFQQRRR